MKPFFLYLTLFGMFSCTECDTKQGAAIRATATTQGSTPSTRGAYMETSANGMQALVIAKKKGEDDYTSPYALGTMTFGETAVGFDPGFSGNALLPANGRALTLCAYYPASLWIANVSNPNCTFDGTQDVMAAVEVDMQEGGTQVSSFAFRHLLTRLNFRAYASTIDVASALGMIKKLTLFPKSMSTFPVTVTMAPADGTTTFSGQSTRWKTYTPDDRETLDFALADAVGSINARAVATTMLAPFIATNSQNIQLTATMANGATKTCTLSIPNTNGAGTQGQTYTVTMKFTTQGIEATTSETTAWEDESLTTDMGKEEVTANCYIITDNSEKTYSFNATKRGNGYESLTDPNVSGIDYTSLPALIDATQARVIWQTGNSASQLLINPASVKLQDGRVFYQITGKVNEGNAVIGIFASAAENTPCLWSWHIWKVNGPLPEDVDCVKWVHNLSAPPPTTSFKMMPLNLGAYNNTPGNAGAIGLLYQWGRKDPFPGPADFGYFSKEPSNIYGKVVNASGNITTFTGIYKIPYVESNTTYGKEMWAVAHPGVFIQSTTGHWEINKKDVFWGTPWTEELFFGHNMNRGTKSIYDPCPVGYRVPPSETWTMEGPSGYDASAVNGNGITFNKMATNFWFPFSGARPGGSNPNISSTPFFKAGSWGYYWSSSFMPINTSSGSSFSGSHLVVRSSDGYHFSPSSSLSTTYGASIRCVAE